MIFVELAYLNPGPYGARGIGGILSGICPSVSSSCRRFN